MVFRFRPMAVVFGSILMAVKLSLGSLRIRSLVLTYRDPLLRNLVRDLNGEGSGFFLGMFRRVPSACPKGETAFASVNQNARPHVGVNSDFRQRRACPFR